MGVTSPRMIHIQSLGQPRVVGPNGELHVGRKEFALLVYLARHSPRAVPREELATLLWGERQDTQARQSLRQALVRLKRAVDLPIEVRGDSVTLLPGAWGLDVVAFEADCGQLKWRDAVARWNGDFLLRMEDAGGESYRSWLESEREAVRRRAGHAFGCLVAEAEEGGDWAAAVEWAERGAVAQPLEERVHRRLIEILRLAGRPDDALARHAAFATRVRREHDVSPSNDFERLGVELANEARAARPGEPKPGSRALFTPDLVGRTASFSELSTAWAAARAGSAVGVLVEGEEGIGKTRLCDEFLRSLGPPGAAPLVLRARGYEAGRSVPWALARELLAPLKDAPGLLGASPGALAGLGRLVPAVRERLPLQPARAQDEWAAADAVAEVLGAVAAETPVVLFVDDLAVGDSDSQQLVLALARRLHGDRVLLLLAARTEDLERAAEQAGLRVGRDLRRVRLKPLTPGEVEALLASMLELPLDERRTLATRLHQETGGLPLFIVETVAALVDEGYVAPDAGGRWRAGMTVRAGPLPLATGVREAVARRLAFLSGAARRLGDAAAVLAIPAERDVLLAVSGLPPVEFDAALEELLARHLLRGPAEAYAFVHEASRRATYELVPTARRRALHAAAGRALRAHPGEGREAILRYHRARAGTAAWAIPAWARSRGAAIGAITLAAVGGLALILNWPAGIGFRDRDWIVLANVQNQTGDSLFDPSLAAALSVGLSQSRYVNVYPPERVRETLRRMERDTVRVLDEGLAREVAQREGLRAVVALAIAQSDTGYTLTARIVDPASGADLATLVARAGPDRVLYALDDLSRQLRRRMGESLRSVQRHNVSLPHASTASLEALQRFAEGREAYVAGRWLEARALWEEAIALDSAFAWAHASLGGLSYFMNNQDEGDRHFRAALNLLGRLPERERLWIRQLAAKGDEGIRLARDYVREYPDDRDGWYSVGRRLQDAYRLEEAIDAYARGLAIDSHHVRSLLNTAVCYDALGRAREAVAAFERAFAITPVWVTDVGGDINRIYGFSYLRVGDSARARTVFQRVLGGDAAHQASGHRSLALYEMYYGRYDRAIAHLREAVRVLPSGITEYRNRLYLAAAYRAKGEAASADVQLAAVDEIQRRTPVPAGFLAFLGQQLAMDGRVVEAERVLDLMTARMDPALDRGAVELVRGEIARAKGDMGTALEALDLATTLTPYNYIRTALARAQVEAGQWERAVTTYQAPWIVASYELGRLYEARGDTTNAIASYERFVRRWAAGDADLVVLADARNRLRKFGRRVEAPG
jgi:DNA-binding SARP family transcriptional activator/tetratricopeptide (TPR) repeat protein